MHAINWIVPHVVSPCRNLDLLCSVKYKNNLPDIPFDSKFLSYPFDSQRLAADVTYSRIVSNNIM